MSADHTPVAERVIAAELAACILGHRNRDELRMDLTGQLARLVIAHRISAADIGAALLPTMRRIAAAVADLTKRLP